MFSKLYEEGFIFFEGMSLKEDTIAHIKDVRNYTEGVYPYGKYCRYAMPKGMPDKVYTDINMALPKEIRELTDSFNLTWGSIIAEKGFELIPHNDSKYQLNGTTGMALVIFWVCEDESFEGRNFSWGRLKDPDKKPIPVERFSYGNMHYDWDDPNLETLGSIKPKTGNGVIIDWTNPIWWHGVTQLKSDHKIMTVSGMIR